MDEDELRGLMLAVDVPPSGADVRHAMDTGRRRNRGQALVVVGAGLAVFAAAGAFVAFGPTRAGPARTDTVAAPGTVPPGGPRCVPTLLELPQGAGGVITAVDPAGSTFSVWLDVTPPRSVLWQDGKVTELGGDPVGEVVAMNADTVVGYMSNESDDTTGWMSKGGKRTTLAKLDGYAWTNPNAINATGTIAGWVHGKSLDDTAPVTWSPDGKVHKLRLPAGVGVTGVTSATARGIGDDGTVVGEVHGAPVVWAPDGTPRALPLPAGADGGTAWAVAGRYAYGQAAGAAIRWDLTTNTLVTLPDLGDFGAWSGTAAGTALVPGDRRTQPSTRIGLDGTRDELMGPGGEMALALEISGDGNTIGGIVVEGEKGRPAIWHCR